MILTSCCKVLLYYSIPEPNLLLLFAVVQLKILLRLGSSLLMRNTDVPNLNRGFCDANACKILRVMAKCLSGLFTKPPDRLPPYRTTSGDRSVRRFPVDIFPFCREWPVTKEPAAL